jgi:AcrR family transcriptional regulator
MVPFVKPGVDRPMSIASTGEQWHDAAPLESERHLRADAQRNRERILEATGTLLATRGVGVSVDEIAQLAQVGVGTVYRNFPTKGALLEGLLAARIEPLVVAARAATGSDDPGDAFISFVRRLSDEFVSFKALADAMCEPESGIDINAAKGRVLGDLLNAVGALFDEAQRAGRIRPDVTIADVAAMMGGLGHADPAFMDQAQRSRCVALVCDSLLVDARSVLPLRPEEV